MKRPGGCDGCTSPATRELLQIPSREPFLDPMFACDAGARVYGWHWTRAIRIPPAATAPAPEVPLSSGSGVDGELVSRAERRAERPRVRRAIAAGVR